MSTFGDKAPEQASILGGGSIVGCAASCFLRLRIRGEVVGEQQHMELHNGDDGQSIHPAALLAYTSRVDGRRRPF